MTPTTRYPLPARLLHWITALLVLAMLALGLAMVDSLADWRRSAIAVHKLCGMSILLLALARLGLKPFYHAPPLVDSLPLIQRRIAAISHILLYALLLALPLVGLAMQGAAGIPVPLYGPHVLVVPIGENIVLYGWLRAAHSVLGWSLVALATLHILAAVHHAAVRKDGLLRRML